MKDYVEVIVVFVSITGMLLFPFFGGLYILNNDALYLGEFFVAIEIALILFAMYVFSKNHKKPLLILMIVCLVIGASFTFPHFYKESLATVDDGEVDLSVYEPFTGSKKLARLEKEASLRLEEELPKLDGATALYPLYAAFAEAVYPEGFYDSYTSSIRSSTTLRAYDRLIKGEVDIIFAAGPSDSQIKAAKNAGVELEMTPIGREAFVFFVNARNSVSNLSAEEIRKIYAGQLTNWQEVGGKDDEIRPFQRPDGSGSQTTFIKFMGDVPIQQPETDDVASAMGGIISEVADYRNYRNAMGYTFRFYSTEMVRNEKIKLIGIDGVKPTLETIRSGSYPLVSDFYAITAGSENPNIDPLLEWILSPEGQKLVEETGFVSVKE
jgi:phosphate transport system substrate-binding protein